MPVKLGDIVILDGSNNSISQALQQRLNPVAMNEKNGTENPWSEGYTFFNSLALVGYQT